MWTALAQLWKSAKPTLEPRPAVDLTARYDVAPGAAAEAIGADLVLLDLERGSAFRLNATGCFVYEELRQGRTPAASARALAARHEIDTARVERDVTAVVGQLLQSGLIAPAQGAPRAPAR